VARVSAADLSLVGASAGAAGCSACAGDFDSAGASAAGSAAKHAGKNDQIANSRAANDERRNGISLHSRETKRVFDSIGREGESDKNSDHVSKNHPFASLVTANADQSGKSVLCFQSVDGLAPRILPSQAEKKPH
jgi:hypothetical protein